MDNLCKPAVLVSQGSAITSTESPNLDSQLVACWRITPQGTSGLTSDATIRPVCHSKKALVRSKLELVRSKLELVRSKLELVRSKLELVQQELGSKLELELVHSRLELELVHSRLEPVHRLGRN
jgi:hypothetical protein